MSTVDKAIQIASDLDTLCYPSEIRAIVEALNTAGLLVKETEVITENPLIKIKEDYPRMHHRMKLESGKAARGEKTWGGPAELRKEIWRAIDELSEWRSGARHI